MWSCGLNQIKYNSNYIYKTHIQNYRFLDVYIINVYYVMYKFLHILAQRTTKEYT